MATFMKNYTPMTSSASQELPDVVTLDMGLVCNQQVPIADDTTPEAESKIRVAVGFVPKPGVAVGTSFDIKTELTVTSGVSFTVQYTVSLSCSEVFVIGHQTI